MTLFMKEHALLVVVQIVQFCSILLIYWLDGYKNVDLLLYSIFIGFFFLICYLVYQYYRHRHFYQRLTTPIQSLDESLQVMDQTSLSEAFNQLLKTQYKLYQHRIKAVERNQEEHLTFMDRWVHQMKTPLSVIELSAQDLDEPDSSNIREETERLKTGLNTVLYMARLRTIEQDFQINAVHLSKVINDVNQDNKRFYIRNQVYPKLYEEKKGIKVETDEKWLYFILSQLINNAVKYSSGKSNQVIISVYEDEGKRSIILEVQDFGVGIPKADLKRVFTAFYTGENGRIYRESTGMGLYLTKEVVDHLEHQIEVESEVGKGTKVRIHFNT